MLNKTRRVAAALVVLPAVLAASACGKTDTPAPTTNQSSAASSAATSEAPASGQPYKDKDAFIAAMKSSASSATSAHVEMTMDAAGQKITMAGDTKVDPSNPAMKMTMDMGSSMKIDMILVDKKVYMKGFPGIAAGKWAVLDSSSAAGKQLVDSLNQADPTKMYDQFDKGVKSVKFLKEDTVDGAKTWNYELVLDTKAMAGALPTEGASQLPDTLTYLAWLDEDNHLRKVTFDIMGSKAEMTMSKYGEPVDVQAPPAADTVKAPM